MWPLRRGLSLFSKVIEDFAWRLPRTGPPGTPTRTCTFSTVIEVQESIEEIRSRIFGNHIGNGLRSGRKILRRKLIGEKVATYYPEPVSKLDPMFVDTNIERYILHSPVLFACSRYEERIAFIFLRPGNRKKAKLEKLRRRGKAPPKKGQGRRASKKR
jgi:small subunit ribosomal protein S33